MTPREFMRATHARLVAAARRQYAEDPSRMAGMDFETFIAVVDRLGDTIDRLQDAKTDLAHIGMGIDFYHRTMQHVLNELKKLDEEQSDGKKGDAGQPDRRAVREAAADQGEGAGETQAGGGGGGDQASAP